MNADLLSLLRCPECRGAFTSSAEGLRCDGCGRRYPVVDEVPRFVPPENYARNFGLQWNRFRLTQLDSHSGQPISRERFQRETGWTEADLSGTLVLDVGCGAGRFAEVALDLGARVVAVDYSSAVDACRLNLSHRNLHVVQADVYALPFAAGTFDRIYSLGVVQHTPNVEAAVKALVAPLKPGGWLVVDVYEKNARAAVHPRRWLRPVTTRMHPETLFGLVEWAAPSLLRVSNAVGRLPGAGSWLRRLVPVANYGGILPLTSTQLHEWAVLDTFDWLAPRYDQPQTAHTLRRWLNECGLVDVQVARLDHLTARGRKPLVN